MPDDTANAAPSAEPPPPVPSVFISYAAEDRSAARNLRDTLTSAGLDVWYDENELSGGDSWDQKIRRQIRDCEYFMPVISANTEARKEGYFRREWRLATERTLDMADDVLFLIPVAIDDTSEAGARVPEKFLSVQWLRAPGGQPTPAFTALLARLRAGDHHALPRRASGATRAPFAYHRSAAASPAPAPALGPTAPPFLPPPPAAAGGTEPEDHTPPPMPPFPHIPEKGGFFHGVKFLAEVLWWLITATWIVLMRLPRWVRIVIGVWILLSVLSSLRCSRDSDRPASAPAPRATAGRGAGEGQKKLRQAVENATGQSGREGGLKVEKLDISRLASEVAHVFGEGFRDSVATGKPLVVVPFARPNDDSPGGKFAHNVFLALYGRLSLDRRNEVSVVAPLRGEPPLPVLQARAAALGANFVLTAAITGEAEAATLRVRLYSAATHAIAWTGNFAVNDADDTAVAEKIAAQVLELVPRKEPRRPPKP